jgi:hypothetical protein
MSTLQRGRGELHVSHEKQHQAFGIRVSSAGRTGLELIDHLDVSDRLKLSCWTFRHPLPRFTLPAVTEQSQVTLPEDRADKLDRARSTPSQTRASPLQTTVTAPAVTTSNQAMPTNEITTFQVDDENRGEDPLRDGAIRAPLRDMVTAVASISKAGPGRDPLGLQESSTSSDASRRKRPRVEPISPSGPHISHGPSWRRYSHLHQHLDPITCGIVSENEAERLFNL